MVETISAGQRGRQCHFSLRQKVVNSGLGNISRPHLPPPVQCNCVHHHKTPFPTQSSANFKTYLTILSTFELCFVLKVNAFIQQIIEPPFWGIIYKVIETKCYFTVK